jgi:dihydroorotase
VLPYTARQFARAIVMPNLVPPVTTVAAAEAYAARIRAALPPGSSFTPLMTCYVTDSIDPDEVERGYRSGAWVAAKLYPAKATTNSEFGVTDMRLIRPVLERMAALGMPLLVHGEVTDQHVDIFDREAAYIEQVLKPLLAEGPGLKLVLEHITTEEAVAFVEQAPATVAATITAHHLVINRSDLFAGGIRPHLYCLPIAKREKHRLALRRAATSGNAKFFLGTDSAPHTATAKETACGCAGCFTAVAALETYIKVFDEEGALDRFEAFASLNGPRFYGLPLNEGTVTLSRGVLELPDRIEAAGGHLVPFLGGSRLDWRVAAVSA